MKSYTAYQRPVQERDRLIVDHIDVARRIALRVARRVPEWLCIDDLIAAGMIGLAEAAERYDSTRGEPFIAFAEKRIRGAVYDELRRGDIMPRRIRHKARKIGRAIRALEQSLGREPDDLEIANELEVSIEVYRDDLAMLTHVAIVELESPEMQPDAHRTSEEFSPARQVERRELVARIKDCLQNLSQRDAIVLSLYYNEEFTYSEIGDLLGVSESRVCQLHARAISRLRTELNDQESDDG